MAAVVQNMKMGVLNKLPIANLALTNQYQVTISGIDIGNLKVHLQDKGIDKQFLDGGIGIMCCEASLPTSSFATSEVKDNYQGINQQFAHTRIYIDSDFTFYVDRDYNVLRFFEGWMDYISGENNPKLNINKTDDPHYYRRFNYPYRSGPADLKTNGNVGYKCGSLEIAKFDRNMDRKEMKFDSRTYGNVILYKFINAFPKGMTSIPISYGGADILKVNVQFAYDRYLLG